MNENVIEKVEMKVIADKKIIHNGRATVAVLNNKFKGIAVCSESDIYDVQMGENIAISRAMIQLIENEIAAQIERGNEIKRMVKAEMAIKKQIELEEKLKEEQEILEEKRSEKRLERKLERRLKNKKNKYRIYAGDVLIESKADVIAHQVNCRGIMGAGIAKAIKTMYPYTNETYIDFCDNSIFNSPLGKCLLIEEDDRYIANIFGQNGFSRYGIQTDYVALRSGLQHMKCLMEQQGLTSVSFPYMIGCGLAGGNIDTVMDIIKEVFDNTNIMVDFYDINNVSNEEDENLWL
jgi:O-acetyl-ADP-ribose deacetylase (regulator of RNase III)